MNGWTTCIFGLIVVMFLRRTKAGNCKTSAEGGNDYGEKPSSNVDNIDVGSGITILLNHGDFEIDCTCGDITKWEFYTKTNIGDVYLQIWRPAGGNTYTLVGQTQHTVTGITILLNHGDFEIDCTCGDITKWEFYTKTNIGDVYLQIWRPAGGNTYTLVGQTQHTVTAGESDSTVTFTPSPTFTTNEGDYIGLYFPNAAVVTYDTINGNWWTRRHDVTESSTVGLVSAGTSHDFGARYTYRDRDYGVRVTVARSDGPSFTNLPQTVTISDTLTTSVIFTLTVTDPGGETPTTTMASSTQLTFDSSSFEVSNNGQLSSQTFTKRFQATDGCGESSSGTLTVVVTNSVPVITSLPSYAAITEHETTERLLHTIATTDASPSDSVTCSRQSTTPTSNNFIVKQIPSTSNYGIYLKQSPTLNYDTTKRYKITVSCTDTKASTTGLFVVYVTPNQTPVFTNLQGTTSLSSTSSSGTSVYTVTHTDAEGNSVTFSPLTCAQATCPFSINSNGEITTTSSMSGLTPVGYDISLTISDAYSTSKVKTLTVLMTDINTIPIITNIPLASALSVPENTAIGSTVYTVTTRDIDRHQTLTFTAASFSPISGASLFEVMPNTGDVKTKAAINYEVLTDFNYDISISVSDGTDSDTEILRITIENVNEPPTFQLGTYALHGNEGVQGTSLGIPSFIVTDPDIGDTKTYTVDCPEFVMDSSSTEVTYTIDYNLDVVGTASSVTCITTVTDTDGEFDTALLQMSISEVNDYAPAFEFSSYTLYGSAYNNIGDLIGNTNASDSDLGIYGSFSYTLDQSTLRKSYFGINANGDIYVISDLLDLAGSATYLTVTVIDYGGKNSTSDVIIVIPVTTTLAATTTTERYRTFVEEPANIAWLTSMLIVGLGLMCILAYLITYKDLCKPVSDYLECNKRKRRRLKPAKGKKILKKVKARENGLKTKRGAVNVY